MDTLFALKLILLIVIALLFKVLRVCLNVLSMCIYLACKKSRVSCSTADVLLYYSYDLLHYIAYRWLDGIVIRTSGSRHVTL